MLGVSLHRRIGAFLLVAVLLGALVGCSDDSSASEKTTDTVSPTLDRAASAAAQKSKQQAADRLKLARVLAAQKRAAAVRSKDRRLFLMSDSVMLGAQSTLPKALPSWKVNLDGKESRFFTAGLDVLAARRKEIGRIAVIQMGNNYAGNATQFREQINQAMKILKGVQWVVFLTVFEYRPEQAEVNNELRGRGHPLSEPPGRGLERVRASSSGPHVP